MDLDIVVIIALTIVAFALGLCIAAIKDRYTDDEVVDVIPINVSDSQHVTIIIYNGESTDA